MKFWWRLYQQLGQKRLMKSLEISKYKYRSSINYWISRIRESWVTGSPNGEEVRGRGWTRRDMGYTTIWEPGGADFLLNANGLNFSIISKEQHLTNVRIFEYLQTNECQFYIFKDETRHWTRWYARHDREHSLSTVHNIITIITNESQSLTLAQIFTKLKNQLLRASKSHQRYQHPIISSSVPDESFAEFCETL